MTERELLLIFCVGMLVYILLDSFWKSKVHERLTKLERDKNK